jgi:hypothetical protein
MPTVGERLATLEQIARENRDRLDTVTDLLNGGDGLPYDRSVRGRLHIIENSLAGMVLRRNYGVGMLKGWQSVVLVLCAIGTAAAAWYSVLSR